MSELDYSKDVMITHDALDLDWIYQPVTYMKWAEKAADADKIVREAKEVLEKTDAEVDLEIRASFEGSAKKPTETLIKSQVITDIRHVNATIALNDAIYCANICQSAVRAMDHKKTALENLVRLWAGSYFSGPKEPRNLDEKFRSDKRIAENTREQLKNHSKNN
jgi:hypothetical protein